MERKASNFPNIFITRYLPAQVFGVENSTFANAFTSAVERNSKLILVGYLGKLSKYEAKLEPFDDNN